MWTDLGRLKSDVTDAANRYAEYTERTLKYRAELIDKLKNQHEGDELTIKQLKKQLHDKAQGWIWRTWQRKAQDGQDNLVIVRGFAPNGTVYMIRSFTPDIRGTWAVLHEYETIAEMLTTSAMGVVVAEHHYKELNEAKNEA